MEYEQFVLFSILAAIVIGVIVFALFTRREKKKKKDIPSFTVRDSGVEEKQETSVEKKIRAYVWDEKILQPELIENPIGNIWIVEPPLSESGSYYFCLHKDGEYTAFEPRIDKMEENNTPRDTYDALLWDSEVHGVYISTLNRWEQIRGILPYVIAGGFIFIVLAVVG